MIFISNEFVFWVWTKFLFR